MKDSPTRFPRMIDAIMLGDIAYFFCKDDFFTACFKRVFDNYFAGKEDIRLRIEKMETIRNKLYHGNPISFREAEQAICYSNDFIDAYKNYYSVRGKEKEYNVPFFTKVEDCFGRCQYRTDDRIGSCFTERERKTLRPGEEYKIWVEVDSNFPEDSYSIAWYIDDKKVGTGYCFTYIPSIKDVSDLMFLNCELTSKKEWHKYKYHDDSFSVCIGEILPPIKDSY